MPDENAVKVENEKAEKVGNKARFTPGTTRVLKMIFVVNGGASVTWNLKYPKATVAKAEVTAFMNEVITDSVILYNNNEATEIKDFYIYETTYSEIPT